jgi:hypothetical protein
VVSDRLVTLSVARHRSSAVLVKVPALVVLLYRRVVLAEQQARAGLLRSLAGPVDRDREPVGRRV